MSASELGPRSTIGRYRVLRRLSVGGMAEVFLAMVEGPGEFKKFVTLKCILPDYREDEEFVRMFLEEARITAALSHANIAQVFDLRADDDALYLAMEYVEGEDLQRMLRAFMKARRAVPIGLTCMVIRDAANALHHAHSFADASGARTPIIHRDVSPKNIMVAYSGSVKLLDFGIAKMKVETQIVRSTSVKGSRGYMSPEQIEGSVDARSDLFSLGAVMYEMLTGAPAFVTRGKIEVPSPDQLPPPPALLRPEVGAALSAVAMQALELDPAKRFASGKDMARAIEAAAPELFDQERTAAVMHEMFAEGIASVRAQLHTSEQVAAEEPRSDTERTSPAATDVWSHAPAEAQSPLVLVVDDSHASLEVLKAQLGRAGFNVAGASTGREAIGMLDRIKPNAIILDVVMPELSGYEVCKLIREREPFRETPILFVSAACSLEERIRGLEAGGDDFIRKPYSAAELALRVRSHLARVAVMHE